MVLVDSNVLLDWLTRDPTDAQATSPQQGLL